MASFLLFAADQPMEPTSPWWAQMMPIIIIMGAVFLMFSFSSRNQRKQQAALMAALKKNDKIINSGGIIGIVESVKDDEVALKGGIRVTKSSIVRIIGGEAVKEQEK
jgi:preprotein translocase subunit YajC